MSLLLGWLAVSVVATQGSRLPTPAEPGSAVPTATEIELEVLENVKRQPLGDGTVEDLALPEEFLRRVADRIVRSSYEERYRIVVRDPAASGKGRDAASATASEGLARLLPLLCGALALTLAGWIFVARRKARTLAPVLFVATGNGPWGGGIEVHRPPTPHAVAVWRASLREARPSLRGFRAPRIGSASLEAVPIDLPVEPGLRRGAALVGVRLARDGLLATTAAAIEAVGVSEVERAGRTDRLIAMGLPVDWLESFTLAGNGGSGAEEIVRALARALESGSPSDAAKALLVGATFAYRPSLAGFAVATESGELGIAAVRLQISSPAYYSGPGDGSCLDLARQLVAVLPGVDFLASLEEKHLEGTLATLRTWPDGLTERLTLVSEGLPVAQWAQDNGKPGFVPTGSGSAAGAVILVPRYASRGEEGAVLVPGETFLAEGLASTGHRVHRSPLLFQGGDLLAVRDPRSGERLLLVGEANVWRNTSLGLSRDQVLEAFRIEFGVDRCAVLPAVSFHIDQELTVRAHGDRLIGFVADPGEAVRIVLRCGVSALETAGVLSAAQADQTRTDLDARRDLGFLEQVLPLLSSRSSAFGHFPESLANFFSAGPADSGVGNLQRFLLAIDLLTSRSMPVDELPLDPHSIAYLRSFRRQDEERARMIADLRGLGLDVARVPSLPEANRGIDYLNGVQDRDRYLMPAWGGLYAPLDEAAAGAFKRALGPSIAILPVYTGESQRRGGGVHCSASILPQPQESRVGR